MNLTLADVQKIAHLARISVTPAQTEEVRIKLTGIFALIAQMQAVDTRGVEPMAHAQDVSLSLRDDRVTESDQREKFQKIAPQVENGLYLVPKVIE
ncbi:MAG: Asp-tRNA(Asn)/Glu-tRNA(Gln) amidotransferase subunit GatC [Betaproteobacteria bacterium]|nr:Asp-tRNA(Asn)/Glu-tRNA(Gln) amidotransferase subunit GatC [Betaproteobacteria bacterium]